MKIRVAMTIMTDAVRAADAPPRRNTSRRSGMKLALALMLMTTTLGSGTAALAAAQGRVLKADPQGAGLLADQTNDRTLTFVDDDGDDDGGQGGWLSSSDDEDDDDDDCEADEDDDDCTSATTGNASKAGSTAPPRNGLFTDGTAPVVKSN
jgi:hypothetical protein